MQLCHVIVILQSSDLLDVSIFIVHFSMKPAHLWSLLPPTSPLPSITTSSHPCTTDDLLSHLSRLGGAVSREGWTSRGSTTDSRGPRGHVGPRRAGHDAAPTTVAPPAATTAGGGRGGATAAVRGRGIPRGVVVRPSGGRWGHRHHAQPDLALAGAP
jgi:hypothetical protein